MPIHEVIIHVGDVDRAIDFYVGVCGFDHVRTIEHEHGTVAELDADGQRISLVSSDAPGVSLALPAENVAKLHRRLKRADVALRTDKPVEVDGGAWLAFTDPWGNQLGFWQPNDDATGPS